MKRGEKKKGNSVVWFLGISFALTALGSVEEPGGFAALAVLLGIFLVVLPLLKAAKRKKSQAGLSPELRSSAAAPRWDAAEEHCHDRLHPEHASACEDPMIHWKKQLDGFLSAGIIDRAEYRQLMERYRRSIDG